METYTDFAQVYDIFMDDTPYGEWCRLIAGWISEYGISKPHGAENEENLIVDLGCGTGTLTELLAAQGYDCIGIDCSVDMLNAAMAKRDISESKILYLCQDMREMELFSTVGCVISVCDSLNYLLSEEDISDTFCRVNNYLYPGGIFIFDFNTVYKYKTVIGNTTIAENREDCSFIWENFYHEKEHINEYDVTVFVKMEDEISMEEDRYRRFQETHYQRGYTLQQMREYLKRAGLTFVSAFDSQTLGEVREDSERIFVIAREHGKTVNAACKKGTGEYV